HPLAVGTDDATLYLAMQRVPGVTLTKRLRKAPLTVRETVRVGLDLLRALSEVHRHGIQHRDVKPSNVMVPEEVIGRATLIGFVLARSEWLDQGVVARKDVGSLRYVAPEQLGLTHDEVDGRADLYSVGAVLFECLAGRAFCDGDDGTEVLRQHV